MIALVSNKVESWSEISREKIRYLYVSKISRNVTHSREISVIGGRITLSELLCVGETHLRACLSNNKCSKSVL